MFANVQAAACNHSIVINGLCQDCRYCWHQTVLNGTCTHCGMNAPYDIPTGTIILPTKLCDDAELTCLFCGYGGCDMMVEFSIPGTRRWCGVHSRCVVKSSSWQPIGS